MALVAKFAILSLAETELKYRPNFTFNNRTAYSPGEFELIIEPNLFALRETHFSSSSFATLESP